MCNPAPSEQQEPVRATFSDRSSHDPGVRRMGRLRLPLAGAYRPWATLFRLPDHRLLWCVRLWNTDHAERRCVSTDVLRRFARINRLPQLLTAIDALVARALDRDADP